MFRIHSIFSISFNLFVVSIDNGCRGDVVCFNGAGSCNVGCGVCVVVVIGVLVVVVMMVLEVAIVTVVLSFAKKAIFWCPCLSYKCRCWYFC